LFLEVKFSTPLLFIFFSFTAQVSDSAWESISQVNADFHFTTCKLGLANIDTQNPNVPVGHSIPERSQQSGKKLVSFMLGLLSTIISWREKSYQESATHEKTAQAT